MLMELAAVVPMSISEPFLYFFLTLEIYLEPFLKYELNLVTLLIPDKHIKIISFSIREI